jgi:hypothetical protein
MSMATFICGGALADDNLTVENGSINFYHENSVVYSQPLIAVDSITFIVSTTASVSDYYSVHIKEAGAFQIAVDQIDSVKIERIPSLLDRFEANWLSDNTVENNARMSMKFADYPSFWLDDMLGRSPVTDVPVQVTIAKSNNQTLMGFTGINAYITGNDGSSFNVDNQLRNLPLSADTELGEISTAKLLSGTYTKNIGLRLGDIPYFQELAGSFAALLANYHITSASYALHNGNITGKFGATEDTAIYSLTFDVTTTINTDIPSIILLLAGISDISSLLPTPQQLIAEVVCVRQ